MSMCALHMPYFAAIPNRVRTAVLSAIYFGCYCEKILCVGRHFLASSCASGVSGWNAVLAISVVSTSHFERFSCRGRSELGPSCMTSMRWRFSSSAFGAYPFPLRLRIFRLARVSQGGVLRVTGVQMQCSGHIRSAYMNDSMVGRE